MIEYRNIWKSFGPKTILKGVDLMVEQAEIVFIVGSSGAGKSVLVKHLVGLLKPDQGDIYLDGQEISRLSEPEFYPIRKRVGYVFQHSTLFDSLTILENLVLPIRQHRKVSKKESRERAMEKLKLVRMEHVAGRYPAELSDGMRKQVAIARTLTMEPAYVIYDEPTTGLDPLAARRVDRLIREMSDQLGVTSMVVSHDLTSIFTISDRIALLYKGEFLFDGDRQAFRKETNPIIQQYIHGRAEGPMEI